MELARPSFSPAPSSRARGATESLLAFARADLELRLARQEALLGLAYDPDAYDALIARRRAFAQSLAEQPAPRAG